jgi:hypothetical protein
MKVKHYRQAVTNDLRHWPSSSTVHQKHIGFWAASQLGSPSAMSNKFASAVHAESDQT